MLRNDIICALATPSGMGAIATIRISGAGAVSWFEPLFTSIKTKKKLSQVNSHTAHFGTIQKDGAILDEVLVTVFKNPMSFSGEDSV